MNIIIRGADVLVRENGAYSIVKKDIGIENDIISYVGEIPEDFIVDKVINANGKLATPSLINCHTHAYMSVFRNLADDLPFDKWLFESIMPREDKMTCKQALIGAKLSLLEMIKTGTGCFVDMHMFPGASANAASELGMRAVLSRGLAGDIGTDGGAERRFKEAITEISEYADNPLFSFMIAPHAIYTCSEKTLKYSAELAQKLGLGINIHLSETTHEFESCQKEHGMTPVEYCDNLGLLNEKTLAAHLVKLTDNDIEILAKRKVNVASCPISNMKLANGFAPIDKLMKAGLNITLGTDSCASNNTVNLFPDMRAFALIHKARLEDALCVSASDTIDAVTVNAAKALALNCGEIKTGKLADITLFNLDCPSFSPKNNLVSALAYSVSGYEADTLIVGGKIIMQKGEVLTADTEKIYYEAQKVIESL